MEDLKRIDLMDVIVNVIAAAIVYAGVIVLRSRFPALDSDQLSLIASIVAILLLLVIHRFRVAGLFSTEPILLPLIFALITILAIWQSPGPPDEDSDTAILRPTDTLSPTSTYAPTNAPADALAPTANIIQSTQCTGRSAGALESFYADQEYKPTGYMGDTGDIVNVDKGPESMRFTYEAKGRGPHEWEHKYYDNGELNPNPAQFAGVMYLYCGWGEERPCFDLRAFRRAITWEARSLSGEVDVEFGIGGVEWIWDENEKVRVSPPCPDSLRRKPLGTKSLNESWQSFEADLSELPEEEFENVVGGFFWIITWGSNGIQLNDEGTGPKEPITFEIEVRNVRYER